MQLAPAPSSPSTDGAARLLVSSKATLDQLAAQRAQSPTPWDANSAALTRQAIVQAFDGAAVIAGIRPEFGPLTQRVAESTKALSYVSRYAMKELGLSVYIRDLVQQHGGGDTERALNGLVDATRGAVSNLLTVLA